MHDVQLPPIRTRAYASPTTIGEVLSLLDEHGAGARIVAGGTDLMVELDRRIGGPVDTLVDITRVPELQGVQVADGLVQIRALATHNECATSEVVVDHGLALAQACLEVGSPALRNRATVVGNVVTASPANDTISALRALDATVEIASATGTRSVPLADFHTGVRSTVLEPTELVTAVSFPARGEGSASVFVKLGLRRAQAISVVHLAIRCDRTTDGTVTDAAVALGSVAPTIVRAPDAEAALVGSTLDPTAIAGAAEAAAGAVSPIDDLRAPADYRRELIPIMVTRALDALASGTQGAAHRADAPTLGGPAVPADGVGVAAEAGTTLTTTINGESVTAEWEPTSLLDWIRDRAGLTGTKEGCAEGECGACTVHLDGVATLSCLVPSGRAHGARVTTIEGLADDRLHPLQQGFVDAAAVQCGYCIPGFLMAGAALTADTPEPEPDRIEIGLSGNLCRCTGYYPIAAAFDAEGRS